MAHSESRQPSNIVWVVLAGILGVFALSGPKSSTEDTPSTTHDGSKEEKTDGSQPVASGGGPLDPLDDFLASNSRPKHPFTDNAHLADKDYERQLLRQYKRDYLIVTVPDPVDSQFGYAFDELMDSIQRALEMRDYVIDRAWLPWELDKRKPVRTKIVTDWRELAAVVFLSQGGKNGEETASKREANPGTLLFRYCHGTALRIVFLIGENPTSGIDKRALRRAIELICHDQPTKDPLTIRIVGPYFTGSETSLRMVLHDPIYLHNPIYQRLAFNVLSGGAMGVDRKAFCTADGRVQFQATVIPTKQVLRATLHYLEQRAQSRWDDSNFTFSTKWLSSVALLTESNTGFGRALIPPYGDKGNKLLTTTDSNDTGYLELRFPLHMAWLRSQYEKARRLREENLNLPAFDSLIPRLGNKVPDQDSIPLQDAATTSSANGEVLQNILSIIRRDGIRYVGIIATDPRDQIMLASAVRDNCPAVQIFLIGSDRLLTLPEYSYSLQGSSLRGTIIGSTYPLIPANQDRTDPKKQKPRIFFPSEPAQGYYNAILAQTGGDKQMIEYRPPLFRNDKEFPYRPPVWISMIGANGELVPLQFFTALGESQGYVWPPEAPPEREIVEKMDLPFPATDVLTLVAIGALCLLVVYYALFTKTLRLFWTTGQNSELRNCWEDYLYRTICLISLIVLLVPLTELCWLASPGIQWGEPWGFSKKIALALPIGILFSLGLALFSPIVQKVLDKTPARNVSTTQAAWLLYGLGILGIFNAIVYVWYCSYVSDGLDSWKALFFERALNLTTGVSPLLPLSLLSATFFFWAFYQLRRSHLADRFQMPCPYPTPPDAGGVVKDISDMDKALRDEINSSWNLLKEKWEIFVVGGIIVVIGTVRLCLLWVPTPEGLLWDLFFILAFVVGFFLTALNLMRFLLLWGRIKKLLHKIALVRMMNAFDRLPRKVVVAFGGYFLTRRPWLSLLRPLHHQLGLLRSETDRLVKIPEDPQVAPHVEDLISIQQDLAGYKGEDFDSSKGSETEEQIVRIISGLSERFRKTTNLLMKLLQVFWPQHSFQEAFGSYAIEEKSDKEKEKSDKDKPDSDSAETGIGVFQHWVGLAEDFIAMQVVIYLSQFFIQLRNLAWSIIVCSSLLLLGATSYPFQPERLMLLLLLALIGSAIAGILFVLVRINQDELISHITRTSPNKFTPDWGFMSSFLTYIVPMGTVVALQMSGAFRFLLEPLVRVLH